MSAPLSVSRAVCFLVRLVVLLLAVVPYVCGAEMLGRGLVAVADRKPGIFLSWRLLASDRPGTAFHVDRLTPAGRERLTQRPLTDVTWFRDAEALVGTTVRYVVTPVWDGRDLPAEASAEIEGDAPAVPYHVIPLKTREGYAAVEASAADLDGDGELELVVLQNGRAKDNSQAGLTDPPFLQAYRMDGTFLWEINLGPNIRAGAHYTPFIAFDLDGDRKAEIACRTADGTVDGKGAILGKPGVRHANEAGHILAGPEFLTVFDGLTGAERDTVNYEPPRHPRKPLNPTPAELKEIWGDDYGNRSERYLAGVAYLDGTRPSLIMTRGYYTRATLAAWDFRGGRLVKRWLFDSDAGPSSNRAYRGQGNHSLAIADVDGDGRDEIVFGAAVIDDDGRGLYSTGWGHGDALHVSDFHPGHAGQEIVSIQERFAGEGLAMREAGTGKPIFAIPSASAAREGADKGEGPGRGLAADIDPGYPGSESWALGAGMSKIYAASGEPICDMPRGMPTNFAIWWDGDLLRELLDRNAVSKWNPSTQTVDRLFTARECTATNGTKATPVLAGDLWGDWREEIIWRTGDGSALHVYTSTLPTVHRMTTLLQDRQYRAAIAWQNAGYNQPPHPSFALENAPGLSHPPADGP